MSHWHTPDHEVTLGGAGEGAGAPDLVHGPAGTFKAITPRAGQAGGSR